MLKELNQKMGEEKEEEEKEEEEELMASIVQMLYTLGIHPVSQNNYNKIQFLHSNKILIHVELNLYH
jgi:hypothetical protein